MRNGQHFSSTICRFKSHSPQRLLRGSLFKDNLPESWEAKSEKTKNPLSPINSLFGSNRPIKSFSEGQLATSIPGAIVLVPVLLEHSDVTGARSCGIRMASEWHLRTFHTLLNLIFPEKKFTLFFFLKFLTIFQKKKLFNFSHLQKKSLFHLFKFFPRILCLF